MKPHVVALICARGGSKGVPRKNLRPLAGEPLLAHAISAARHSSLIDRVVVSTDDDEIAETARRCGAEVPFMRPGHLAQDDSPEWAVWQHAIRSLQQEAGSPAIDVVISVPTTAPCRIPADLDRCVRALVESTADIVITVTEARRNPYFNMVTMAPNGAVQLAASPAETIHRRQEAPAVYDITTVAYATRPEFVLRASGLFDGVVHAIEVPAERAIDLDTELDFRIAELLLSDAGMRSSA